MEITIIVFRCRLHATFNMSFGRLCACFSNRNHSLGGRWHNPKKDPCSFHSCYFLLPKSMQESCCLAFAGVIFDYILLIMQPHCRAILYTKRMNGHNQSTVNFMTSQQSDFKCINLNMNLGSLYTKTSPPFSAKTEMVPLLQK